LATQMPLSVDVTDAVNAAPCAVGHEHWPGHGFAGGG
jgi:hypothetical protein